jgi:hypothetical protein
LRSITLENFLFMTHFENLSPSELQQLEEVVVQISILVAGADGTIDAEEAAWADKLAHIRGYSGEKWLQEFYDAVAANFKIRFNDLVKSLPTDTALRQTTLATEIAKVNPILAKLDAKTAYKMYHSYQTLALSIAKASGGLLGFGSVSRAEQKVVDLPMITPIAEPVIEHPTED